MNISLLVGVAVLMVMAMAMAQDPSTRPTTQPVPPVLQFQMKSLEGEDVDLSRYQGKVLLIVNTASKCGFTPQYKGLQELHTRYQDKGLAVLGFPANDFGNQEPGTDEQIAEFCESRFGVTFDMFSKVTVKGPDKAPLFGYLTDKQTNPESPGEIRWNFEKFLVSRDGRIIGRFPSKVGPDSPELIAAIESALNGAH